MLKSLLRPIKYILNGKYFVRSDLEFKKNNIPFNSKNYFYSYGEISIYFIKSTIKKFILHFYYSFNSSNLEKNSEYIYFASQLQPEATSCPEGDTFNDNIKVISMLSKTIPSNWKIYYKEHPSSFYPDPLYYGDMSRSIKYYNDLKKIKNVKFIKSNENVFNIIDGSKFCVTIAGSTGLECSIRKKNCLIFSNTWYRDFPFIHYVNNKKKIRNLISSNFKEKKSKKNKNVLNLLTNFFMKTLKTYSIYELSTPNMLSKDTKKIENYLKNSI